MDAIDKRRVRLSCLRSTIHADVAYIKELSDITEHFLKQEFRAIINRANEESAENLSEFKKGFIAECYAEDVDKIQEVFPRILRYSLFVTSMTKLECNIVLLCKGAQKIFELSADFNPKPPNVINRAIEYLEKHIGINIKKFSHYTELIENYRMVRNCIVHSEGTSQNEVKTNHSYASLLQKTVH